MKISDLKQHLFRISTSEELANAALSVFNHQAKNNSIYGNYLDSIKIVPSHIKAIDNIPYLPIELFKNHEIKTGLFEPEIVFTSSGTAGSAQSSHFVKDLQLYKDTFLKGFEHFYGPPKDYVILGLLPSYLERKGSSLITMVDELCQLTGRKESGFFLYDHERLSDTITRCERIGQKTLLIGVTFALLDFAEHFPMKLEHTIIMETGGMKGRKDEMVRAEVSEILQNSFQLKAVHSEYGMTELLSQAYSSGNGIFECPPWMHISVRDTSDPLSNFHLGSGAINIIDLANVDSCSFIATQDLGKVYSNGSFEITGRFDQADIRGCNLLVV